MVYEIWDLESGNAVGDFESQESALAEVRAMALEHGPDLLIPWALERHEGNTIVSVAEGERLISMAMAIVQQIEDQPSQQAGRTNPRDDPPSPDGPESQEKARINNAVNWNDLVQRYVDPTVRDEGELRRILNSIPPERRSWFKTIADVKLHDQDVAGNPFIQGGTVTTTGAEDDPIMRAGAALELNERKRSLINNW